MVNEKDLSMTMGRRWLIFFSVFSVGIFAGFNMFKAPPLFMAIMPELGFTEDTIGWVMSMFSIIGVVLAFPAGAILKKLGVRTSLLITAASLVVGSALGAVSMNAAMLLATRLIEGIGLGLISVVGPAAVASIIPRSKQGLAMGIWTIWFPFAIVVALNVAPAIYSLAGWRMVWWVGAVLSLLSFVFVLAVYKQPPPEKAEAGAEAMAGSPAADLKPDYRSLIFATLAFGLWNVFFGGAIASFYPTFLQQAHGMGVQFAGTASSITTIIVLVLGPLSGIISDKLDTRKWLMVFAMAGATVMLTFAFGESIALVWVYLIGMAVFAAAMPTGTFSIVPRLMKDPAKIGFGMAVLAFFQNIGIVLGSAGFGPLSVSLGWHMASLVFLVPAAAIGFVLSLLIKEKRVRKNVPDEEA